MPDSPYKFLDFYRVEDQKLFFGRTRETEILLSDIVINRLVVLFAKTGTGKTSLINAGVRPLLHERDYETFFIRVRKGDPIVSAREHLSDRGYILEGDTLSSQLENLSNRLDKSIVLFFDQFEEFFIYVGGRSELGLQFIAEVGQLYRNEKSGVHIVFSMREEFLYELDHFRNEIPTIFHNDSTLRLRGFDRDQALEAITAPAKQFKYDFHPDLLRRLVDDLISINSTEESTSDAIEPTQLQIVCDTLWKKKSDNPIPLSDYVTPEDETRRVNPAQRILDERLEAELSNIKTDAQLQLLDRLLPLLRTEANTKNVRDVNGLAAILEVDKDSLQQLLVQLKNSRLIQESGKEDSILVELSHDYLADEKRIKYLQDRVRHIWLERMRVRGDSVSIEDMQKISDNVSDWRLDREQASFLFRSALANGWEMRKWFDQAKRVNVGVWDILREKITSSNEAEMGNAIDILRELPEPEAIKLLGTVMGTESPFVFVKPTIEAAAHSRDAKVANEARNILEKIAARFQGPASDPGNTRTTYRESQWSYRSDQQSSSRSYKLDVALSPALGPPFNFIREALNDGRVIPLLGAGAATIGLPSEVELAQYLAKRVNFPDGEPADLGSVAQYYSVVAGRKPLQEELHEIFSRTYPESKLHSFLARISRPLLILTTNYDDLIERAFDAEGHPYDLIVYSATQTTGEQLLWRSHETGETQEIQPNKLDIDLDRTTVIYKMNGSIHRENPEQDSMVITEDDYVDFLARISKNRVIPAVLAEPLQTGHLLFLGYSVQDWALRGILNRFERDVRRPKGIVSWAIQPHPSAIEIAYWQSRRVDVYDMTIERFVEELSQSNE